MNLFKFFLLSSLILSIWCVPLGADDELSMDQASSLQPDHTDINQHSDTKPKHETVPDSSFTTKGSSTVGILIAVAIVLILIILAGLVVIYCRYCHNTEQSNNAQGSGDIPSGANNQNIKGHLAPDPDDQDEVNIKQSTDKSRSKGNLQKLDYKNFETKIKWYFFRWQKQS